MLRTTARRGRGTILLALAALLFLTAVLSVGIGSVRIPPLQVLEAVFGSNPELSKQVSTIVMKIRLPRVTLGLLVGAGLSVAGASFQGLFRNPLADPHLIGVSAGAAVGAAVALAAFPHQAFFGVSVLPLFSFTGALLAVSAVYVLARGGGGRLSTATLILAGTALAALLGAGISMAQTMGDEKLQKALIYWLAGGMNVATWEHIRMAVPYIAVGIGLLLFYGREINALLMGEETALQLGVDVEKVKRILLAGASLVTAACVSVTGLIPFVGLVVPHVVRLLLGPDYRYLLPGSAVAGAILLVLADTLGRTAFAPTEIRVSIVTALLGGPFFLYLLRQKLVKGE